MTLKDDLEAEVGRLFGSVWNITNGRVVPTSDTSITFKNDGTHIQATVLYADLADSTVLVDNKPDWFAAEIYKAFLSCAGKVVLDQGGEITAYDGDRIMAVYIGADQCDRAVRSAQMINWAVINIIQPKLVEYMDIRHRDYVLKHVVGVDTSQLLVAKIGVRSNSDLVWVGRAANHAAKLASEDDAYSTYVTTAVYEGMTDRVRLSGGVGENLWGAVASSKMPGTYAYRSNSYWTLGVAP
jgi:class 3 adenylate cyclase